MLSLVGWVDLGSEIVLDFFLILWKNPFENKIFKTKMPSVLWIHLPPTVTLIALMSYSALLLLKILLMKTLSSVRT